MDSFFLGFVSVCAAILGIGLWLLRRADKKAGKLEAVIDEMTAEQEIIEQNKQVVWRNEKLINNLSDADINKLLREEWTRE